MKKSDLNPLIQLAHDGDFRSLARLISLVENNTQESKEILTHLSIDYSIPVIGITGPPGAGKSTLIDAILSHIQAENKKVAVLAVDPSSPFNLGALLGDRIRLSTHFNNPNFFIRSLASRGSLGGLAEKTMEVVDVLRSAQFDYIFIETVGVGQTEVEISGLADTTVVVLVPEAGDDIQAMKSGLMEVADVFVVNKADRPEAAKFALSIKQLAHTHHDDSWKTPVLKTTATKGEGIEELLTQIHAHNALKGLTEKHIYFLASKMYAIIQKERMKDVDIQKLITVIEESAQQNKNLNIYSLTQEYLEATS